MKKITAFRLSAKDAKRMIREAAKDSGRVFITDDVSSGLYEARMTRLQVIRCLEDGDLIGKPALNDFKDWECRLERFAVGVCIRITVVLERRDDGTHDLFVIKVSKE